MWTILTFKEHQWHGDPNLLDEGEISPGLTTNLLVTLAATMPKARMYTEACSVKMFWGDFWAIIRAGSTTSVSGMLGDRTLVPCGSTEKTTLEGLLEVCCTLAKCHRGRRCADWTLNDLLVNCELRHILQGRNNSRVHKQKWTKSLLAFGVWGSAISPPEIYREHWRGNCAYRFVYYMYYLHGLALLGGCVGGGLVGFCGF